jgi:hypothetical protein
MSKIGSYKNTVFSESQKFLVLDPSTSSTSLVLGSDLVAYITPQIGSVKAESTRLSAENTDYKVGELVQTSGATAIGDGLASVYLVVAGGSGNFPMLNGNDLLVLIGDDALRAQLISEVAGQGASLISMEGGPTVEAAVNNRVIRVSSRTEMKTYDVPAGYQFSLSEGGRSGLFVVKAGTPPADTLEGLYVVLTNGNYAERMAVRFIDPAWYGADITGATSTDPEWSAAIDHALLMGFSIMPSAGTYKKTASTAKDNFTGLYVFGRGQVTIDFQVDDAFAFGDFTQDGSSFFTQTAITCSDIVFSGVKFSPSANGWDGSTFAYARPLAFSSAQNVHVTDSCQFYDNHVGAVDFSAPCKDVYINHCHFESSEEAGSTYGPRPFCYVAPLDAYDEVTGTLLYPEPIVFHENININFNTFRQIGRGIVSWNVHGFDYGNNTFRKPLVRTISCTNWNFDGSVHHNLHIAEDNLVQTLSTFVNIGTGTSRVKISNERFAGSLSGIAPNNSLKCVDCGGVSEQIEVLNNTFNTVNMASAVNVGPNVEITISQKNLFMQNVSGAANAPIVLNESAASAPTFDFPKVIISDNIDYANNRFVQLGGPPPGNAEAIEITGNVLKVLQVNGMVASNTTVAGWKLRAAENDLVLGGFNYVQNFGTASVVLLNYDKLESSLITIPTVGASVTLDWKDYGGDAWYVVPDVSQTITDIVGELSGGQRLTIIAGGTITFPQGNFRLVGAANVTIGTNDSISFISRSGLWFETQRAAT